MSYFLAEKGAKSHKDSVDIYVNCYNEIGAGRTHAEVIFLVGIKLVDNINNKDYWLLKN